MAGGDLIVRCSSLLGSRRGGRGLQPLRPAAGVVMDAEDLQCSALKAIGNYDRCVRHDQLARTRDAAGMAKLGIFGEIASDTIEDAFDDALRSVRVIPCDVLA